MNTHVVERTGAAASAVGIYLLSLKLAEPLLLQRELAIIERVAATE